MSYIATTALQKEQNRLSLHLVNYDLPSQWNSHRLIKELRDKIYARMPHGLFDPQDLEHQVLFRLTTFDPADITDETIEECIAEQLLIIENRLKSISSELPYLFRGLDCHSKDLNAEQRLELKNDNGSLYAIGHGRRFEVEFKKITDTAVIDLFTEKLHYIHSARHRGDAFGFYFKGDTMPWGVETVEPSIIAKQYKRDALLAHGIDPNKAIEITRLYLLPGSPKNAISILDGLVARHYKAQGLEAMYTTTMPTYAKTKGATTAGGMKEVLLVKELSHTFRKEVIKRKTLYVHDVNGASAAACGQISTHRAFPTLYTVETFMRLNQSKDIQPLPTLKNRVIFIDDDRRRSSVDHEAKFLINDVSDCLEKLRAIATYKDTTHIHDRFWGCDDKPKLRLRKVYRDGISSYEVSRKYRISKEAHIRTQVTELLYNGADKARAEAVIAEEGAYRPENSLEKVRMHYAAPSVRFRLDIYPFGAYLEVSGHVDNVWVAAASLGYQKRDSLTLTADETYLEWAHERGLKELWDVRFGLRAQEEVLYE